MMGLQDSKRAVGSLDLKTLSSSTAAPASWSERLSMEVPSIVSWIILSQVMAIA